MSGKDESEVEGAARSLRQILHPRSLAVVGASRQPGSIGSTLVGIARSCGYTGSIYPVNPKAGEICGLKCYPSLGAIGMPVDVALIAVPAPHVEAAVQDCAAAGVKGVIVISAGFSEMSAEGREAENRIVELVRTSGMRMVGPNCMGIVNTDPAISLNATFVPAWPPPGNIGLLSQSGALGYVVLDRIQALNIGISTFVSVGNQADVSLNDLLCYWAEDPTTKVIVLYLESFESPRVFARIAPRVARVKPIVAIKAGRSAAGTRAASSHSAALASRDAGVDALFEQAGVIRADTLEELMDISILLSSQPLPPGRRVGIVTNGGGPGILLADACEARGLEVPLLTESTVAELRTRLPSQASMTNPVDMIASAGPEHYASAIRLIGNDPNVDSLVVIYIPPPYHKVEQMVETITQAAGEVPLEKPVLTVFMSSLPAPAFSGQGPRGRLPCYGFPENAALALSAAERYARRRQKPTGTAYSLDRGSRAAVRAVFERILQARPCPVWLEPEDLAAVLRAAGIEYAATVTVSPEDLPAAADRLGYPLVMKVVSRSILHKSDVGGVLLGLRSPEDIKAGLGTLRERMGRQGLELERVLLQREVHGGIEALVGVTTDPNFGPLVVCGLGGIQVELLKDVSFRLAPLAREEAEEMLECLRSSRLLGGYRGSPPADRDSLVEMILKVSALMEIIPELQEVDLNPVKVLEPGRGAVVVDGRMRIGRI